VTAISWVEGADGSPYGVQTLPYGMFVRTGGRSVPTVGVRIADFVLDMAGAERADLVDAGGAFAASTLNAFMALGRTAWDRVRRQLTVLLTDPGQAGVVRPFLVPLGDCQMLLPFEVADYVDFYSSEHHASNVGQIFRPGQRPLTPNWRHLPIGYHGRAGTVVVTGTDVVRPRGQQNESGDSVTFGPSVRLDIEAEVGFVVGVPSRLGASVGPDAFVDHVFGVVLVNDWSARDLQAFETPPLGPFLAKSFATSISAWVLPLTALDGARVTAPRQDPPVARYLAETDRRGYDLAITVTLNGTVVSRPPFATMYWTPAQQLAHLTINGASLRTGDLYASGTVSGPARDQTGSLLERTWNGTEPLTLDDRSRRGFLLDGDTVTLTATAPGADGTIIALGDVTGTVRPSPR
jgi:fumarylacetoacetase